MEQRKYYVQAFAQWLLKLPHIYVSVMNEDGTPVTNLKKANFKPGRVGNGGIWSSRTVTNINLQGASSGIYFLILGDNSPNFFHDAIFTIEVVKQAGRGDKGTNFRGQCLAPMLTQKE